MNDNYTRKLAQPCKEFPYQLQALMTTGEADVDPAASF